MAASRVPAEGCSAEQQGPASRCAQGRPGGTKSPAFTHDPPLAPKAPARVFGKPLRGSGRAPSEPSNVAREREKRVEDAAKELHSAENERKRLASRAAPPRVAIVAIKGPRGRVLGHRQVVDLPSRGELRQLDAKIARLRAVVGATPAARLANAQAAVDRRLAGAA